MINRAIMAERNLYLHPDRDQNAVSIWLVDKAGFDNWLKALKPLAQAAVAAQKFKADAATHVILPDGADGFAVAGGVRDASHLSSWCLARLAEALPAGNYRLADGQQAGAAMLGWIAGQYRFDRYRSAPKAEGPRVLLVREAKAMQAAIVAAEATMLVRDLVNTPAEDMGPAQLEDAVRALAKPFNADVKVTSGDALTQQFPMVHMVGRAAARSHAPRLIELDWGKAEHPRLALVGKGVCFDSGGLDIKPAAGMLLMKKDMGGAAHAIALAQMVMDAGLPVRLHLVVAAVENAIAGNAFRPGDVLQSRKGDSVEIQNTDAEGRLVLGDALWLAGEHQPDLVIDFATLTGAARVALGPDLPAMFARKRETALALIEAGTACDDPLWELPLWDGYRDYLKSDIADIANSHANGFAGATVGALFLDRFIQPGIDWVHFDTFAWRPVSKPGRPKGGDALGMRACFGMIQARYGG